MPKVKKNVGKSLFLTVCSGQKKKVFRFEKGLTVKEILDNNSIRIRSACSGNGACGLCKIRLESWPVPGAESIERLQLTQQEIQNNVRLACQTVPLEDLTIFISDLVCASDWTELPEANYQTPYPINVLKYGSESGTAKSPLGLSIDLGTTNLSLSLFNLHSGQELCRWTGPNPQARYGADIVTRLVAAREKPENLEALQVEVLAGLSQALKLIGQGQESALANIRSVIVLGNSAMLSLLTGSGCEQLLGFKNRDFKLESEDIWAEKAGFKKHFSPDAEIEVLAPLAGFIGSDLIAGLVSTRLMQRPGPSLLIDFGTNSEIALYNHKQVWVSSAAGGPAFEGVGISCGLPAEKGAIYRALYNGSGWQFQTIGGHGATGVCASGLVDILGILLSTGQLSTIGNFAVQIDNGFKLPGLDIEFILYKSDIDLMQKAKAAIGVGIIVLCREAGIDISELQQVYICGALGNYLNVEHARLMGLLPDVRVEQVQVCGNTALKGGMDILLSDEAKKEAQRIQSLARVVNLSLSLDFEDLYLENLYLRPLSSVWTS